MHISGTETSSVILSQTKKFQKLECGVPNVPKQAEAKRYRVINTQNYNFNQFLNGNFLCSQNATNQLKPTVFLIYMCPLLFLSYDN